MNQTFGKFWFSSAVQLEGALYFRLISIWWSQDEESFLVNGYFPFDLILLVAVFKIYAIDSFFCFVFQYFGTFFVANGNLKIR